MILLSLQVGQLLDKVDRQEALMQHATRSLTNLYLVAVYYCRTLNFGHP